MMLMVALHLLLMLLLVDVNLRIKREREQHTHTQRKKEKGKGLSPYDVGKCLFLMVFLIFSFKQQTLGSNPCLFSIPKGF